MTSPGVFGELFEAVKGELNERARRLLAGARARALGRGGIALVSQETGLSLPTVRAGIRELEQPDVSWMPGRVRRPGGGRKRTVDKDPTLKQDLEQLVEPVTRGDPESPLRWTAKSVRKLAAELQRQGHQVSRRIVAELLDELGYSLQANRKTREGSQHPDRNAQFEYINEAVQQQLASGNPAISVDTKKKELVGDFKNGGREWRPKGNPEPVRVHDFQLPELGKVAPYGIYDISRNTGWVSVGIDHDTAEFAVQSIRTWWNEMGKASYPTASNLLITADCGGSNGARVRLWKLELQQFADELQMPITVAHVPPGTSKWNKIEHRLFSFITQNWRGKPLINHAAIVQLIAATRTEAGLTVRARLDPATYAKGRKVTDVQMASINIRHHDFHGEWNYTISPRSHADNSKLIS
jgi:transposase